MTNKKEVTVIIVTYKSTHIISQTLKNIVNKGYRIIIVDNASGDNIKEFLQENYKNSGIELIILENNCGFGKANNVALKKVFSKYALILNPDAIITPKSINNLVLEADKDDKIALASPFCIKKEKSSKIEIAKYLEDYKLIIKNFKENDDVIETNFICGGYMLMKIQIFKKIGFFDKNLFLYGEDDEISNRSFNLGYKNILVKNAYAFHSGQNSTKITSKKDHYKMIYFRNWHQGWGKTYLKRKKKNIFLIAIKSLYQLLSSILYIFIPKKNYAIIRLARSIGSFSNILGISCFNKKNKIVKTVTYSII